MILLAPRRAMGGIQAWASAVTQGWRGELTQIDTSPPLRLPSEGLSPVIAVSGLVFGIRVWVKALYWARKNDDGIWAATSPSLGYRVRDVPFLLLAQCIGVRVVLHVHGSLLNGLLGTGGLSRRWARAGLRAAHAVVVLDARTQTELEHFAGRNVARLSNFISPRTTPPRTRVSAEQLLYVGRVSPEKGSDVLLELGRRLDEHSSLVVVGPVAPGIERDFRVEARRSGIRLEGQLTPAEVKRAMDKADVLILPSHHEGFPMVVLEAMSAGLPVVASDVGACREMLLAGPGEPAGIVLENPRDVGAERFVDQLLSSLGDVAVTRCIGGPERVMTRYSSDVVLPAMQALLEEERSS